jgi:hypothetical protein
MDTEALKQSFQRLFKPEELTTVVLAKEFKRGDLLALSEPPTELTQRAPNDLLLVKLIVGPGNPGPAGAPSTSPGVGIEVWLPTPENWNERVHAMGGGGFVGGPATSTGAVAWPYAALLAGAEGAVSSFTDTGHAPIDGSWGMNPDGTLARQLWLDYAHRGIHEQAVKTKALATAYYGRPPRFCYFEGASTGGRQGYKLAQAYPEDYDGIVANLPAMNWPQWTASVLYRRLVTERDLGGVPLTEEQMDLVSNAAIRSCDVVGGVHLGYIMDNEACRYDPAQDPEVLCVSDGGNDASPHCVTKAQAEAINKMWYGLTVDGSAPPPEVDNGTGLELTGKRRWHGLTRGTSLYLAYFTKQDPVMSKRLREAQQAGDDPAADQVALQLQNPTIAGPGFKNASGNGEALWRKLSHEQLSNAFDRGRALDAVFGGLASDDPDLSAFRARGGKMLSWHGWNDESIPIQTTIRYYESVVQEMGGLEKVQSFFKLYLVPGAGHMSPHGTSNPDANPPAVAPGQFYRLLVDWVENGIEPGRVEIRSPSADRPQITQPIFPYPQKAKYVGGDPHVASSYVAA